MLSKKSELFKRVETRLRGYKLLDLKMKNLDLNIESLKSEIAEIKEKESFEVTNGLGKGQAYNDEIVLKTKEIIRLKNELRQTELEKEKIANAIMSLDGREERFFNIYYNSKNKKSMVEVAKELKIDRSSCYPIKDCIVGKVIQILYPEDNQSS